MNKEVIKNMATKKLSKYACTDNKFVLLKEELEDIRPRFFRDADRIIYSLSYTRYIDKTQVFTFNGNDHISKRITHVQFVSKIARTIGRGLNLNEDLIEAASLGHDLGHPPFGHCGEAVLNKISIENNEGVFLHNVQSVRTLMNIEDKNISIQVLDAILCHNGEILEGKYSYMPKTKEDFIKDYKNCCINKEYSKKIKPMTIEGCVVRISDIIGYVGRDIEDAIRLGIIKKEDIPTCITSVLGDNNKTIVNTIVMDILNNSYDKPYIKLSNKVFNALNDLIVFNYKNIYNIINTDKEKTLYEEMYRILFKKYMKDLNNKNSMISNFLNEMNDEYKNSSSNARIVIDFIAGMTDNYFINEYNKISQIKIKR